MRIANSEKHGVAIRISLFDIGHLEMVVILGMLAVGLLSGCQAPLDGAKPGATPVFSRRFDQVRAGVAPVSNRWKTQVTNLPDQEATDSLPPEDRSELPPVGSPPGTQMICVPPVDAPVGTKTTFALPSEGILDLKTSRAVAVRANPDVHAALARLEAAAARVAQARARYFPTVVLTHNSALTLHTPASRNRLNTALQPLANVPIDIDTTQTFAITALINAIRRPLFGLDRPKGNRTSFSEHSTSLTATWTAFDGFVRQAQLLASKQLHQAAEESLVDVQRLIIQAVDTAYFRVQLAREQLRIARADQAFSFEQLTETETLRRAGRASQADVDNFRVRMLAAQAAVSEALGLTETGRVALAELMGVPTATLPPKLELAHLIEESEEEMTLPDPEVWTERALRNRPDLRQLELILKGEEANVRAAKGLYLPTLAVSGSWGFDRGSTVRYTVQDQSSAAAIEFRWELFTGGSRRARVLQAQATRAQAAAELNRLRLAITARVRSAVIRVGIAQEQIRLQGETLTTARKNRRLVQAGYVAGKETLNRLNEAQRDVITADADLALARTRLRQAWSDLHAAAANYE